jgi:hypothetical protein
VAGAPLLLRLAVASSPGREHPGHQATITVDDRRHRHTHIDLKYPIHVDDYVAKERRPGRSQTTAPQPGEQLTEAGAQPGEFNMVTRSRIATYGCWARVTIWGSAGICSPPDKTLSHWLVMSRWAGTA